LVQPVLWIDADSNTCRDSEFLTREAKWPAQSGEDLPRYCGCVLAVAQFRQEHDKFIPSQPGDRVALPHAGLQPCGDFLQQLVACFVPERVINLFEAVQVEKSKPKTSLVALSEGDTLGEQFSKQAAVWQPREAIVIREVFNLTCMRETRLCFT